MAKTINNTTARDIGAVFDVAYLSDLSAVENALSVRMDSLESSIQADEETIASLQASIEADEQSLGDMMLSIEAHEASLQANSESLAALDQSIQEIGASLDGALGDITALQDSMGLADGSIGILIAWKESLDVALGSFWDREYYRWDFTDPTTHYLSVFTYETTLTDALVALDEAIYNAGTAGAVTLSARATAETGYATTYDLHQGGVLKGSINIPKDFLVKSATLETVATADVPYAGAKVGDKYIDFVINAKDASATAEHIYLPVNDLVDVYTAQPNATQVQLAIDANNVISATIVAGSVGTTELANSAVTTAKIADRAVNSDKIGLVDSATNKLYTIQVASGRLQLAEVAAD